jgi:small-conductance mechanosensitive channel
MATTAAVAVSLPAAARADEVATAQARVDSLQSLVAKTTRVLTDGTRKWEADQASLKIVKLHLTNTTRHVAEAQAVADAGQARLNEMARNLYIRPVAGQLQMLLTRSPSTYVRSVEAIQIVNKVAGSDRTVISQAKTSRHRLQQTEAEAKQLTAEAQQLVDRAATRLQKLAALAQSTSDQLVAAEDALQRARAPARRPPNRPAPTERPATRPPAIERPVPATRSAVGLPVRAGQPTGSRTETWTRRPCAHCGWHRVSGFEGTRPPPSTR